MKRAATLVLVMLAMSASAAVDARALASEGPKTQWAPTRNFSTLNARAVFASESGAATSPYAGEGWETAAGGKEAGFTGHRTESALGLSYAKRRWLDSSTGTWLSRDDIGAASYLHSPNELNPWGYAASNPTRFTDPSGRYVLDVERGTFEFDDKDTTADLIALHQEMSRWAHVSDAESAWWEQTLRDVNGRWGPDEAVFRALLGGRISALANTLAVSHPNDEGAGRGNGAGRAYGKSLAGAGVLASREGAEYTVTIAGFLGTPTSKGDVAVMVAVPIAGAVAWKLVKVSKGALVRVLARTAGRTSVDEALLNDLSRMNGVQVSNAPASWGGEFVNDLVGQSGSGRLIPGTPGVVTGGSSTKLGNNILRSMEVRAPSRVVRGNLQAQHLIPSELRAHPVLKKIGIDLDDATNGIFLPIPSDSASALSRHEGFHGIYNEVVERQLDRLDVSLPTPALERQVADLQRRLRRIQENGNAQLYEQVTTSGRESRPREYWVDLLERMLSKEP